MYLKKIAGHRTVTLQDGSILTQADLPPADTRRWVASRKATVVRAIAAGLISEADAMQRWQLSAEELAEWRRAIALHGVGALRATKLQKYRQP